MSNGEVVKDLISLNNRLLEFGNSDQPEKLRTEIITVVTDLIRLLCEFKTENNSFLINHIAVVKADLQRALTTVNSSSKLVKNLGPGFVISVCCYEASDSLEYFLDLVKRNSAGE
jgi:hypothetical protein